MISSRIFLPLIFTVASLKTSIVDAQQLRRLDLHTHQVKAAKKWYQQLPMALVFQRLTLTSDLAGQGLCQLAVTRTRRERCVDGPRWPKVFFLGRPLTRKWCAYEIPCHEIGSYHSYPMYSRCHGVMVKLRQLRIPGARPSFRPLSGLTSPLGQDFHKGCQTFRFVTHVPVDHHLMWVL